MPLLLERLGLNSFSAKYISEIPFMIHCCTSISLTATEDVDPSVGRFRNMVQTAVVPVKVCN